MVDPTTRVTQAAPAGGPIRGPLGSSITNTPPGFGSPLSPATNRTGVQAINTLNRAIENAETKKDTRMLWALKIGKALSQLSGLALTLSIVSGSVIGFLGAGMGEMAGLAAGVAVGVVTAGIMCCAAWCLFKLANVDNPSQLILELLKSGMEKTTLGSVFNAIRGKNESQRTQVPREGV